VLTYYIGYYCAGPDSQFQYSTASDANTVPDGPDTSNIPRPKFGHVPFGTINTSCLDPGVVALTFDDGPHQYTEELLDYLKVMKVNATFFVTGGSGGKGSIGNPNNPYHNDIQRMLAEGHQIASHTWTHQDLSLVGHDYRLLQITHNEKAIANAIGMVPTYIRPPYLSCDDGCQTDLGALGYHAVNIDLDTNDWQMSMPASIAYFNAGIEQDPAVVGWNV
jgi:peptidoglycan/xylan/chitin deacetylase (PgdA/CDA1 family)